jgi:predicted CopG family antitoxin
MAERLYRAQILLEPEQHEALAEIARQQRRSISEVVREMVALQLQQRERGAQAERLEALERIRQHRAAILARRGGKPLEIDVVGMINEMREKRDERNLAGVSGHRD